jgi:hypothetical protein
MIMYSFMIMYYCVLVCILVCLVCPAIYRKTAFI